jgi:hypothetical protein
MKVIDFFPNFVSVTLGCDSFAGKAVYPIELGLVNIIWKRKAPPSSRMMFMVEDSMSSFVNI